MREIIRFFCTEKDSGNWPVRSMGVPFEFRDVKIFNVRGTPDIAVFEYCVLLVA
jgi:hypothetical protein